MNFIYSKNKKINYEYTILETIEAGIVLLGTEVSSVRQSNIDIKNSYITIKDKKVVLLNSHIAKPNNLASYEVFNEYRERYLLVTKKEFKKLQKSLDIPGNTIVPIEVYQPKGNNIKIKIAIVKGKKLYDKRNDLKERDLKRTINEHKYL